jgi:predicted dinucleotide-binding enzyme
MTEEKALTRNRSIGNIARRAALAGYDVTVSFAWDRAQLATLAEEIEGAAEDPADAATADLVVLLVPWDASPFAEGRRTAGSAWRTRSQA